MTVYGIPALINKASYATLAELKTQIDKTGVTGTGSAANLQLLLDGATACIDRFCNRPDGFVSLAAAVARVYVGSGHTYQWIDECTEITLVEVKDSPTDAGYTAWAAANWIAFAGDPQAADFNRLPYQAIMIAPNETYNIFISGQFTTRRGFQPDTTVTRGTPTVRVTAKYGYAVVVPPSIKQACLIQAARWFKRGESSWADSMAPANFGKLMFIKVLDPDVQLLLSEGRFVKPLIGGRR
jgi:hypothetical protein